MKTLVSKTLTKYAVCMIVILLLAIPIFYWLTKQFYAEDMIDNAVKYCHSTARQAAMVAKAAGVSRLLLGHYSSRYTNEEILLNEAREIFSNSFLTNELQVIDC